MRKIFTSLLLVSSISAVCAETATLTSVPVTTTSAASTPAVAEIQTNLGTITIQLELDKAPITSKNFLDYVNSGFYKNTLFHRSIKDFVVQGGGFDAASMTFKPRNPTIQSEANNGLTLTPGSVSMALSAPNGVTDDHSATSEFFINMKDNTNVITGASSFTVFAQVISGMDLVSKINSYPTVFDSVPYANDSLVSCDLNFCLKKIYIENVYTSKVVDKINSYTRVSVSGKGGRVTSTPSGISCTASSKSCVLKKSFGTAVSLTAKPSTGYEFKGWSGDCSGNVTPLVIDTKAKNNNCTATFAKKGSL